MPPFFTAPTAAAYAALSRDQVALIAAEACALHARTCAQLKELRAAATRELPGP